MINIIKAVFFFYYCCFVPFIWLGKKVVWKFRDTAEVKEKYEKKIMKRAAKKGKQNLYMFEEEAVDDLANPILENINQETTNRANKKAREGDYDLEEGIKDVKRRKEDEQESKKAVREKRKQSEDKYEKALKEGGANEMLAKGDKSEKSRKREKSEKTKEHKAAQEKSEDGDHPYAEGSKKDKREKRKDSKKRGSKDDGHKETKKQKNK